MDETETGDTRRMDSALVIGGTGFVGRHTVAELLANGYDVTTVSRDRHGFRFGDGVPVEQVIGDRTDEAVLREAGRRARTAPDPETGREREPEREWEPEPDLAPDLVVDCAAFHPGDVRTATEVFADVDAYVYVSSGGVYDAHAIPKREDETPLHDCTPEQAADDSMATYGPRKAECDRETAASLH